MDIKDSTNLEDPPSLLVDQSGDPLDPASPGQAPDGRLGDSLDVVAQDFPVPLGPSLAQSFTSFATARHSQAMYLVEKKGNLKLAINLHFLNLCSVGAIKPGTKFPSIAYTLQVIPQLLSNCGSRAWLHGGLVNAYKERLVCLHQVDSSFPLLAPHDIVVPTEVEILLPSKAETGGGQVALAVVVAQDVLDLRGGHVEVGRLGPEIAVMPSDSRFFQILANQLSVYVILPAHIS